jgi:hypothetical protein
MKYSRLTKAAAGVLAAAVLWVVSQGTTAPAPGQREGIIRLTPRVTLPGATPTPVGGTIPGRAYGRGAQSPLQLLQFAKPNLIVYFPFDRDVYDRANPGIPLDIVGHPVYNDGAYAGPGRLRDAVRLGPLAPMFLSVVSAPNTISLDMNQYCTVVAWVLPERLGGLTGAANETILSRGVTMTDPSLSYAFYLSPRGIPTFESRVPTGYPNPGIWTRQASRGIGIGLWRHVAVVFNAGTVTFYIDGQPAGQATAPARAVDGVRFPQCPLYVGARFVTDQVTEIRDPYFGLLDELALWNRPLKDAEIVLLATDADVNGMADFWDQMITGYLPAPISTPLTTTGTVTPTPIPPVPRFSPISLEKGRTPTPTPSGGPARMGPPRLTPTPTPTRTPSRIVPYGRESGPGSPSATPTPRRERQGPPSSPPSRFSGPGSETAPNAPPIRDIRQQPTPRGGTRKPTPTPPGDSGNSSDRTAPSPIRSVR